MLLKGWWNGEIFGHKFINEVPVMSTNSKPCSSQVLKYSGVFFCIEIQIIDHHSQNLFNDELIMMFVNDEWLLLFATSDWLRDHCWLSIESDFIKSDNDIIT